MRKREESRVEKTHKEKRKERQEKRDRERSISKSGCPCVVSLPPRRGHSGPVGAPNRLPPPFSAGSPRPRAQGRRPSLGTDGYSYLCGVAESSSDHLLAL